MREPWIYIVGGRKGVGKSVQSKKEAESYAKIHNKPALVFDVNFPNEQTYADWPLLSMRDVGKVKGAQCRRIPPVNPDGSIMTYTQKQDAVGEIIRDARDCFILLEDYNKYFQGARAQAMMEILTTNRHSRIDLGIHIQNILKMDPTTWENANLIRLHKQSAPLKRLAKRDVVDNLELLLIAEAIVNSQYRQNKRYFLYVYTDYNKLGNVSLQQLRDGCRWYLEENPNVENDIYKKMNLKARNEKDKIKKKSLASFEKALNYFVNEKQEYLK
ncbi:hypothetical protein BKI52_02720 [marine bacterium AO1-C]|nr:hypothetical protein BKI52_02720 [marine bacterium AO1-C]